MQSNYRGREELLIYVITSYSIHYTKLYEHFSYIEDPDGTLIEFVETHKLPIIEKLGWYMKLKGRDPKKSLPKS